jgi:hypothetical protein
MQQAKKMRKKPQRGEGLLFRQEYWLELEFYPE